METCVMTMVGAISVDETRMASAGAATPLPSAIARSISSSSSSAQVKQALRTDDNSL
jgi:hypothetical protein